ncbi:hypothetical protein THIOM_003094 [Candidatus Thiomargarita nelsonii]|uniref:Uncharacterized protein n=1 Tax=Candidatus Thiomargarita nelsonii TaxID=1003181 RepID=A0A176RZN2_9GAMM|nr:hypothetical protein THIOM_003094 [Candidatus Thiomargarita nelsonii]
MHVPKQSIHPINHKKCQAKKRRTKSNRVPSINESTPLFRFAIVSRYAFLCVR